jgi:hypothetical protein
MTLVKSESSLKANGPLARITNGPDHATIPMPYASPALAAARTLQRRGQFFYAALIILRYQLPRT